MEREMNKIYNTKYSIFLGSWITASKIARSHDKTSQLTRPKVRGVPGLQLMPRYFTALLVVRGLSPFEPALAACPADSGGIFQVTTGETCTAMQSSYSGATNSSATVRADNPGSTIQLTAPNVTVTNTTNGNGYALETTTDGIINVEGNLTAVTNGFNGRAIYMAGGTINISGNLVANHLVRAQGAGIEVAGGVLNARGTTAINTAGADGLRNGGQSNFVGDVAINAKNYTQGILNSGTATFGSNLTVNTTDMNAGINMDGGSISVARDLSISTSNTKRDGMGINQERGGTISVQGNTTISTDASSGYGISISKGIFESLGSNNVITTTGINADGIYSRGGVVALGTAASNATLGSMAVMLASGNVTGGQNGIRAENIGTGALDITTSGTVSGNRGAGIVATNAATATNLTVNQTAGTISGSTNGIETINNGTSPTTVTVAGSVIGGTGAGIYISGTAGNTVNQTAGTISGSTNGIETINKGTSPTTVTVAGSVIGGTGAGIYISGTAGNTGVVTLNSGALVSATSGVAVRGGAGNATLIMNSGSKLNGQVLLGEGDNAMIIRGSADISGATLLDGGNSTDASVTGILGTATAATNTLTFDNTTQSLAGSVMKNWEVVTLDNAKVTFSGDAALVTGTGTSPDGSLQGLLIRDSSVLSSPVALDVTGDVSIDATSTLSHSQGGSLTGNVSSAGLIAWANTMPRQTLTINGNYTGVAGSSLALNTVLGDDSSVTDKLVVTGDSAGTTAVSVSNAGGQGAQTVDGIELIHVGGTSTSDAFTQAGRIVAGLYDYTLVKGNASGTDTQSWFLTSRYVPETPVAEPQPQPENRPQNYRPGAGSYTANLMAANTLFNTRLHDRLGETQYTDALTGEKKVTSMWMRNAGGRSSFRMADGQNKITANRYVLQIGGDLAQWSGDDEQRYHLGVMAGYANQHSKTKNSLSGYTSEGRVSGYSTGLYGTFYQNEKDKTGLYVDSWLQYSWFNNTVAGRGLASEEYKSSGLTASVESGYTLHAGSYTTDGGMVNEFYIQPKAQVTWMGVKADDHREHNGTVVQGAGTDNVQTRLGVRAYLNGKSHIDRNTVREFEPFVEANWIHNSRQAGVRMGGEESLSSGTRNIAELKTGVEGKITNNLNLWGNVAQQMGGKGYSDTQAAVGVKFMF